MGLKIISVGMLAMLAVACMTASGRMLDERTAIISGRGAARNSTADVFQASLVEAAKTAQAQGFEYFTINSAADKTKTGYVMNANIAAPIEKPGVDLIVRLYRAEEVDPHQPGVWKADSVLATAAAK